MRPLEIAIPWINRQKIKCSIVGERPEAKAEPVKIKSVINIAGFRPKRSESGPKTSWPKALPSISVEIEAITRLFVVFSASAILGTPARNISMPIGPNMFRHPNMMVRNMRALPPGIYLSDIVISL